MRVNGVSGSAVHALAIVGPLKLNSLFKIVSVGMDQRLSVWNCSLLLNESTEARVDTDVRVNVSQSSSVLGNVLDWICGSACNISDLGDMQLSIAYSTPTAKIDSELENAKPIVNKNSLDLNCIIVGEGIQLFKLQLFET